MKRYQGQQFRGILAKVKVTSSSNDPRPDPVSVFTTEKGFFYDPSDMSTLFQDTAGTIPVTASGQTVALMRDKSPNGYHMIQATSAQRPTFIIKANGARCLNFPPAGATMRTAVASPCGMQTSTMVYGAQTSADTHAMGIVILEDAGGTTDYLTNGGAVYDSGDASGGSVYGPRLGGTASLAFDMKGVANLKLEPGVYEFIKNSASTIRGNGLGLATFAGASTWVAYNTGRITIGKRVAGGGPVEGNRFEGDFYGALHIDRNLSNDELFKTNEYISSNIFPRAGVAAKRHRYWRFLFDVANYGAKSANVANQISIQSLSASEGRTGANLLKFASSITSSTHSSTSASIPNIHDANPTTVWAPTTTGGTGGGKFTTLAPFMLEVDFGASTPRYINSFGVVATASLNPGITTIQWSDDGTTWNEAFGGTIRISSTTGTPYSFTEPTLTTLRQAFFAGVNSYALRTDGLGSSNYHGLGGMFFLDASDANVSTATITNTEASSFLNNAYSPGYLWAPNPDGLGQLQYVSAANVQGCWVTWQYSTPPTLPTKVKLRGYTFTGGSAQAGRDYADIFGIVGISSDTYVSTHNAFRVGARYSVARYLANAREDTITLNTF